MKPTLLPAFAITSVLLSATLGSTGIRRPLPATGPLSRSVGHIVASATMRVPRANHSATLLRNGRILIVGGFAGSGSPYHPYTSTEIYDPVASTFTEGPNMRWGRSAHTATPLADGRVLLAGGWSASNDPQPFAELYDPVTNRFLETGRMQVARAGHSATVLPDGRVLLAGGVDGNEHTLASAEIYDPATGHFSLTGTMVLARSAHSATLLSSGMVLLVGGGSGHYPTETMHAESEIYDPISGRFTQTGALHTARHKHAAVLLIDGSVLVVGGSSNKDASEQYSSAEIFDPRSGSFHDGGSMHLRRFKLPAAVARLPDGTVLIAGGGADAEVYDPITGSFRLVAGGLGAARYFASVTVFAGGRALITGGYAEQADGNMPSTSQSFVYLP